MPCQACVWATASAPTGRLSGKSGVSSRPGTYLSLPKLAGLAALREEDYRERTIGYLDKARACLIEGLKKTR